MSVAAFFGFRPCTVEGCKCDDFDADEESEYGRQTDQLVCTCGHVEDEHEDDL